jgi:predicted ATPase
MYLLDLHIRQDEFPEQDCFPFNVPAFQATSQIRIASPVLLLAGQNGSGKSALLDALSRKAGLLPWGGTKTHKSHGNPHETQLANYLDLVWRERHSYGFYFRAETFFNFAASLDDIILDDPGRDQYYGGRSLNVMSHGEAFLSFFRGYSFRLDGLYLLDEPEAALSPDNQLEFVRIVRDSVREGNKQYIIATHSPIILGCPEAQIISFDHHPIGTVAYRETRHYCLYRDFLKDPGGFFKTDGGK